VAVEVDERNPVLAELVGETTFHKERLDVPTLLSKDLRRCMVLLTVAEKWGKKGQKTQSGHFSAKIARCKLLIFHTYKIISFISYSSDPSDTSGGLRFHLYY